MSMRGRSSSASWAVLAGGALAFALGCSSSGGTGGGGAPGRGGAGGHGGAASTPACSSEIATLVAHTNVPTAIAVSDTHLFWSMEGTHLVATAPLSGKPTSGAIDPSLGQNEAPKALAIAGGALYFDGVRRLPLDAGAARGGAATLIAPAAAFAVDASHLAWGESDVAFAALDGSQPTTLATGHRVAKLALGGDRVVWVDSALSPDATKKWLEIWEAPLSGGAPAHLFGDAALAPADVLALGADASNAVYVDTTGLYAIAKGGGAPKLVSADLGGSLDATTFGASLVVEAGMAHVLVSRLEKGSSTGVSTLAWDYVVVTVATGDVVRRASGKAPQAAPQRAAQLTLDARCVYFTDGGSDGAIRSLAR